MLELLQSVMRRDASLDDKHNPGPLPLPLVLRLRDFRVRVAHHGDQQIDEQNGHDSHVQHEKDLQWKALTTRLPNDSPDLRMRLVLREFHSAVIVAEIAERHEKHRDEAFHRRRDWVELRLGVLLLGIIEREENNVVSLREAHHEDHVDANESQEVTNHHSVYHDYEGPDGLKAAAKRDSLIKHNLSRNANEPAEEEKIWRCCQHNCNCNVILELGKAKELQKRHRQHQPARKQKHHTRWRSALEVN